MRNPRLWRNVALGMVFVGAGAMLAPFQLPTEIASDPVRTALFAFGLTALLFGIGAAVFTHRDERARQRLARGEDVLARWRIDASAWREFIALNEALNAESDNVYNELLIRDEVPADGIEVIAGKTAVEIDGSIHRLPARGTPEITGADFNESRVRPSYIELQLYYPGGGAGASGIPQSAKRSALRFPVPPASKADALRVVAHYRGDTPGTPDFFHGRGDGSDPEDLSKCWSCGFSTHKFQSHCPHCGSTLQSRRWSRRFGVMLVLCGLFLTGLLSLVLYNITPLLLNPDVDMGGTRFGGSRGMGLGILAFLGVVWAFGAITLCYGVFQVATGKRSKRVAKLMVWIFTGFIAVVGLMQLAESLGRP